MKAKSILPLALAAMVLSSCGDNTGNSTQNSTTATQSGPATVTQSEPATVEKQPTFLTRYELHFRTINYWE